MVDSLLEEIGDQLESLGLDPLPIPDIRIPYSLDTVIVLVMLLLESWLVVVCQYIYEYIYGGLFKPANLKPGDRSRAACS